MNSIMYDLSKHGKILSTRDQGQAVRNEIRSILNDENISLEIDFDSIEAITPSFADELLGQLLLKLGKEKFKERIKLSTQKSQIKSVVNLILNKRLRDIDEKPVRKH